MTLSEFDSYRPPETRRRRRSVLRAAQDGFARRRRRPGAGTNDGSREMPVVEDVEFTSYYGRPIVKPPPWGHEIAAYLFLGGLAGGSALLGLGAQLTGRGALRRSTRLTALGAAGAGAVFLIADLGRPERFLHMMRTVKITSPMSLGSWLLGAFSSAAGVAAAAEVDRLLGAHLPLGPLRGLLRGAAGPAGACAGLLGAPLAVYTAVLLSDTANPTWNAARRELPFVFVSSASLASGGMAMLTTAPSQAVPARVLAVLGVGGDLAAMALMQRRMHPAEAEPLRTGAAGTKLRWAERLAIAGGVGTIVGGGNRMAAGAAGLALLTASALTRFGVLEAGIESTRDPRHVIEPQKARLAARRAAGITHDSITTTG